MTVTKNHIFIGLDVGAKRIGVAKADNDTKLAFPLDYIEVDGREYDKLEMLMTEARPTKVVIGYPRNQAGEPTKQTAEVEKFANRLSHMGVPLEFQDESLTSVMAEDRLKNQGQIYSKGQIDSMAAAIILQDYLGVKYGY